MRLIPATMATQHPDNASSPFWGDDAFIDTSQEVKEIYLMYKELRCGEYMWDWEGKFVDEAVIDRLFQKRFKFFKKKQLGKNIFLTFRIPNIWKERGYRIVRSFMSILTSADFAKDLGLYSPPVFEVILPMTENEKQLLYIQKTFHKIAEFKHKIFTSRDQKFLNINIIPLFESVSDICEASSLLKRYIKLHKQTFKRPPEYLRPFIARSDPALNAGLVPAVLSSKIALSKFASFDKKYGIKIFPIIGPGSLPFRGGCNPENIKCFIKEYRGIRTATVQSAFRYDYDKSAVKKAVNILDKTLPKVKAQKITEKDIKKLKKIIDIFKNNYKKTIVNIANHINEIALHIPARRERMLHIGLFGYSRGIGKATLPRAIKFTASLYSLGVPPEFIGTGRSLREIGDEGRILLKKYYLNLENDLSHAGHYINKENLSLLAHENPAWKYIKQDIIDLENLLGKKFGPKNTHHFIHRNLVSSIYHRHKVKEDFTDELVSAAVIRKSLG